MKLYQDKIILISHLAEGLNTVEISKIYNVSGDTIIYWMNKNEIDYNGKKTYKNKKWLKEKYKELKSPTKIAQLVTDLTGRSIEPKSITYWRQKLGIAPLKTSQNARKYFYNERFFSDINTEEKAYWLGFIMADGCIYRGSDKYSYRLQINLKRSDKNHLDKFQKAIGSNYSYQYVESNIEGYEKTYYAVELKINSTMMCKDLMKLGVSVSKSGSEIIPKIDKGLIKYFIRGIFDGDGSIDEKINKKGYSFYNFSIAGSSQIMIKDIRRHLKEEINVHVYMEDRSEYLGSPFYTLRTRNSKSVKKIYDYIYKNPSVYLERKFKLIKRIKVPLQLELFE